MQTKSLVQLLIWAPPPAGRNLLPPHLGRLVPKEKLPSNGTARTGVLAGDRLEDCPTVRPPARRGQCPRLRRHPLPEPLFRGGAVGDQPVNVRESRIQVLAGVAGRIDRAELLVAKEFGKIGGQPLMDFGVAIGHAK